MQKYLRDMARARMKAMGIDKVNRRMKYFWRKALTDPEAEKALMEQGKRMKEQRRRVA